MAGGKGAAFDYDILCLILKGMPIAGLADNAATSPLTNLYLSLHTTDPGAGGDQTTSEAAYSGYARVAVPRSSAGFTASGASATLAATVSFPLPTTSGEIETWAAVGTASTGAGKILYRGPITPNIIITTGIAPQLTTGTTITES